MMSEGLGVGCWRTHDEEETRDVGKQLARDLLPDRALFLYGEMGAGKTVLAQGVAEGLGIDRREVRSPTFTLIHEHRGRLGDLVHIDLFRLEGDEVEVLSLSEVLARPAIKVVEWPDRCRDEPRDAVRLLIREVGAGCRSIERVDRQPAVRTSTARKTI